MASLEDKQLERDLAVLKGLRDDDIVGGGSNGKVPKRPIEPSLFCFRYFTPVESFVDPIAADKQLERDWAVLRGLRDEENEFHPLAKGLHRIGNWLSCFQHRPSRSAAA